VRAGARERQRLAETAGFLQEAQLGAVWRVRVAAGEAAVVAGNPRAASDRPRRAAGMVGEGAAKISGDVPCLAPA